MGVVILDRVFNSDNVAVVVFVDEVDHGRQAGGLAGAGRPCDQQQSSRPNDQPPNRLGHADLIERQKLVGNSPEDHADESLLLEDSDAKAAVAEGDGKVRPAHFLQLLLAAVRGDGLHESGGVVAVEDFGVQPAQSAMMANDGGLTNRDVQVAGLQLNHRRQQLVDQNRCLRHGTSLTAGLRNCQTPGVWRLGSLASGLSALFRPPEDNQLADRENWEN